MAHINQLNMKFTCNKKKEKERKENKRKEKKRKGS
jgi:hypothetical protein